MFNFRQIFIQSCFRKQLKNPKKFRKNVNIFMENRDVNCANRENAFVKRDITWHNSLLSIKRTNRWKLTTSRLTTQRHFFLFFQKDCSRVTVAATKSGMMSRETAPGNGTGTRHILGQKQRSANQKPFEEKIYKFCTIRSHSRMFGKPF